MTGATLLISAGITGRIEFRLEAGNSGMAYGTAGALTSDSGTEVRTCETVKPFSIGKVRGNAKFSFGAASGVAVTICFGRFTTGTGTVRFMADRGVALAAATGSWMVAVAFAGAPLRAGFVWRAFTASALDFSVFDEPGVGAAAATVGAESVVPATRDWSSGTRISGRARSSFV